MENVFFWLLFHQISVPHAFEANRFLKAEPYSVLPSMPSILKWSDLPSSLENYAIECGNLSVGRKLEVFFHSPMFAELCQKLGSVLGRACPRGTHNSRERQTCRVRTPNLWACITAKAQEPGQRVTHSSLTVHLFLSCLKYLLSTYYVLG